GGPAEERHAQPARELRGDAAAARAVEGRDGDEHHAGLRRRAPAATWRVTSAASATRVMIAAIGTALVVPPAPTSGATRAPIRNCDAPSSADAVPATAAWSASASAIELGSTNDRLDTTTNIGASTAPTPS